MIKAILACKRQGVISSQPPQHLMDIQTINVTECLPISASLVNERSENPKGNRETLNSNADGNVVVDRELRLD